MPLPKLLVSLALFATAKLWLRGATAADLCFLLAPVDGIVSAVTGSAGSWQPGVGYHHPGLNVVIDASCAGGNYATILFLFLVYLLSGRWNSWWTLPLAALLAWPLTVLTNASRILVLLRVGQAPAVVPDGVWHQAWGSFVYACSLVLVGLLIHTYERSLSTVRPLKS